jgi:anti-anti-sigma factor
MDFSIQVREARGVTVLDLTGTLVRGEPCAALQRQVEELLGAGAKKLLLNLLELSFLDSLGMNALMKAVILTGEQGGEMKLVRPREMESATRAVNPLDFYESEAEALASFLAS